MKIPYQKMNLQLVGSSSGTTFFLLAACLKMAIFDLKKLGLGGYVCPSVYVKLTSILNMALYYLSEYEG